MEHASGWLFPGTQVETLLQARPMSIELFESFGIQPWKTPHAGIREVCEEHGVPWSEFFRAFSTLPVPGPRSDWKALPIHHLMDYLVGEHRGFLHGYLPAIGNALSNIPDGDAESLQHLRTLAVEWPAFARSFTAHVREEETSLFLRILRYDACLRHGTPEPDFEGGSVRVFTVVKMLEHEHRDMALFRNFLRRAVPDNPLPDGDAFDRRLRPLLAELEGALGRHARLETEVLFPWGMELEKSLYDLHIRGARPAPAMASALSPSTLG